jgi:hypothetical protein
VKSEIRNSKSDTSTNFQMVNEISPISAGVVRLQVPLARSICGAPTAVLSCARRERSVSLAETDSRIRNETFHCKPRRFCSGVAEIDSAQPTLTWRLPRHPLPKGEGFYWVGRIAYRGLKPRGCIPSPHTRLERPRVLNPVNMSRGPGLTNVGTGGVDLSDGNSRAIVRERARSAS